MIPNARRQGRPTPGGHDTPGRGPVHAGPPDEVGRDRTIRVCYLIDRLRPAGTEGQLRTMIQALDRRRVQPHLCLLDGEDPISRSLEPGDCPVLRLGIRRLRSASTLAAAWRFVRFLRLHRIDVMQPHFPDSTYFGTPLARLAGVPRVVRTVRDLGYWMRPIDRWIGRLYNPLVDATLVNSEEVRGAVLRTYRPRSETVVVIENGIDLGRFASLPLPEAGRNGGAPRRIGLVANLRPVKDPESFVRAAAIVAGRHADVEFRVAGEGELRPGLEELARNLGLAGRMRFLGSVEDVPGLLGQLDVAVICSQSEGLSNALLEYMAAGRAIVATAVGGNVGLIRDGVHGLLVPPADPGRLAEAICRLLDDLALASRLAQSAQRRAVERHGLNAKAGELQEFYCRLLGRGQSR